MPSGQDRQRNPLATGGPNVFVEHRYSPIDLARRLFNVAAKLPRIPPLSALEVDKYASISDWKLTDGVGDGGRVKWQVAEGEGSLEFLGGVNR